MVSVSCLSHTVLILISLIHVSKSKEMYLCAKGINLIKNVELNYNEFRIYPGVENSKGECSHTSGNYAYMALKRKHGWKNICECKKVKDDEDLCVYVAEVDSNREEHCGEKSFSLSKVGVETIVRGIAVKRKCGAGNKDGEVDVKMMLQNCGCDGCKSSGGSGGGGSSGGSGSGGGGGGGGGDRIIALAMENDEEVDNHSMIQSEPDTPQNRTIYIIIGATAGLFILCMALTVFRCIRRKGGNKYQTSNSQNDEESDNEVVENVELEMMNNEIDTIEERIKEQVTAS